MTTNEFGSLDLEAMAGEDQRLSTQGGGSNFLDQFVPMPQVKTGQTGSVSLRILPPVKGGRLFQYNRVHTMNDRKIHCPRPLVNGKWNRDVPCPICDYYSNLWRQADKFEKLGQQIQADTLKEEARDIKPVERYYYNAIVRSMTVDGVEQKNVGPRILSIGKILHKMIIRSIVGEDGDPDSKLGNITDLKNGWDFVIRKEMAGEYPKYERSSFARSQSPTGTPEEIAKWVEGLHDLTKLRNPKDVEYLEKELAIHCGHIKDDSESFNNDAFAEKWSQKAADEVKELMEHTPGGVAVLAETSTTGSPNAETASAPAEDAPAEDAPVEDTEFIKELEGFVDG